MIIHLIDKKLCLCLKNRERKEWWLVSFLCCSIRKNRILLNFTQANCTTEWHPRLKTTHFTQNLLKNRLHQTPRILNTHHVIGNDALSLPPKFIFKWTKLMTRIDSVTFPLKSLQACYNWIGKIQSSFTIHDMYWVPSYLILWIPRRKTDYTDHAGQVAWADIIIPTITPNNPSALPKISITRIFTKRDEFWASDRAQLLPIMPTHNLFH